MRFYEVLKNLNRDTFLTEPKRPQYLLQDIHGGVFRYCRDNYYLPLLCCLIKRGRDEVLLFPEQVHYTHYLCLHQLINSVGSFRFQ